MTTSFAVSRVKSNSPSGPRWKVPHRLELRVDVGIVDDLADQVERPVGKLHPGLIGIIHRAVHAVAETEFPSQPEGEADFENVIARRITSTRRE